MPKLTHACQTIVIAAGLAAAAGSTFAQEPAAVTDDKYAWLEDVEGQKPLEWVKAQNAKSEAEIAATPEFKQLEGKILTMLDSDAKIPGVEKIGDYYYNFWKDKNHERGLWRRTTLEEYRKPQPQWETVIDLDALNAAEGLQDDKKWVWHGADCRKPDYTALPDRAVARRLRRRRHPRVRSHHQAMGQGRLLPSRSQGRRWAGKTPIPSTSSPTSAPAA